MYNILHTDIFLVTETQSSVFFEWMKLTEALTHF